MFLCRAINKQGETIDFYLSQTRNYKAGCYTKAIILLKEQGELCEDTIYRQVKYLNNQIESDHGKLKYMIKPTLGFQSLKTAYVTIKGFELMHMFRKKTIKKLVITSLGKSN